MWYLHGTKTSLYAVSTWEDSGYQLPAWERVLDIMKRSIGYHIPTCIEVLYIKYLHGKQSWISCPHRKSSPGYVAPGWEKVMYIMDLHGNLS